jgi:hypothetical protein
MSNSWSRAMIFITGKVTVGVADDLDAALPAYN